MELTSHARIVWCALPGRLAARLDLKGPSASMPQTPCNRKAEESSWPVYGIVCHPHGARALPETLTVSRIVSHKAWPQKRVVSLDSVDERATQCRGSLTGSRA